MAHVGGDGPTLTKANRVPAVVGDTQREVECVVRNPGGDFFGPLDREAPRAHEKIVEHERLDLPRVVKAVGIEVHQRTARRSMQREDRECRACHRFDDAETVREALDESRLARTEIAVERKRGVGRQHIGEFRGERARLFRRGRGDAGPEFFKNSHDFFNHRDTENTE